MYSEDSENSMEWIDLNRPSLSDSLYTQVHLYSPDSHYIRGASLFSFQPHFGHMDGYGRKTKWLHHDGLYTFGKKSLMGVQSRFLFVVFCF